MKEAEPVLKDGGAEFLSQLYRSACPNCGGTHLAPIVKKLGDHVTLVGHCLLCSSLFSPSTGVVISSQSR